MATSSSFSWGSSRSVGGCLRVSCAGDAGKFGVNLGVERVGLRALGGRGLVFDLGVEKGGLVLTNTCTLARAHKQAVPCWERASFCSHTCAQTGDPVLGARLHHHEGGREGRHPVRSQERLRQKGISASYPPRSDPSLRHRTAAGKPPKIQAINPPTQNPSPSGHAARLLQTDCLNFGNRHCSDPNACNACRSTTTRTCPSPSSRSAIVVPPNGQMLARRRDCRPLEIPEMKVI